ncbi:hypothetical protein VKT23_008279 [Stygiomarasmius scandens]|uniref:Uncharacterized protein n=1 Tax=Marasmiellus scandens TaxID=2682957 RepID=A0ABR1JHS5_9AGAR
MLFAQGRAIDLKSLTLRNLPVCPDSAVSRSYQHPSLTTTDNLFRAFVHPNSFSNRFDFPALQALHLYGLDEDCDEDLLDIFLHGSNHLRQLTLFAIWTKDARNRSPIYHNLFEYLDEDALATTSPAFPHLEELTVSQGYYALRRWLRRRIHAGYSPLNRLVITTSCYQLYSEVEDRLEDLLEYAAKDVVVITDPSRCEYTFVEMERMLVKDGKLVQDFSLVPDAMVY